VRTLIIHNTASGSGSDDVFAFQRALLQPGDEAVVRTLGGGAPVEELAADAASFDAVVASGGDGTVAGVAYALRGTGVPLLPFPSGTANLFANNLGSATEPAALAATLRAGRRVRLDLGEFEYVDAEGRPQRRGFLNMAGAGYDAAIMQGSTALKGLFGPLSYYMAAFGNLDPGTARLELVVDGEPLEAEGICVAVANWAQVAPSFEMVPGSSPRDGLLDVAVATARNSVELLPAVATSVFTRGTAERYPNVEVVRAREVSVRCDPPFPMQYDGEVAEGATTPFTARVLPGALTVLVDDLSPFARFAEA
jgi:diacylglycerol kinase family enzyme